MNVCCAPEILRVKLAGVSGHSTAQVTECINDAYEAGADYALLLPCAYFGKQTTPVVVKNFYNEIAETSLTPIILYNFPAVCNGLDLDSEIINSITNENANIVGVKVTCGSVAKITRLAVTFHQERFAVFGGQADFLVGGLAAGSAGCIAAFGNIFPRTIARIYNLWTSGKQTQAYKLQQRASLAEFPTKAGTANTKYGAAKFTAKKAGIENAVALARPRKPYVEPSEADKKWIYEAVKDLDVEESANSSARRENIQLRAHL